MYRLPNSKDQKSVLMPQSIGYAPYPLQALNSEQQMGRIIIVHKPIDRPLRPGPYQVIIGCGEIQSFVDLLIC